MESFFLESYDPSKKFAYVDAIDISPYRQIYLWAEELEADLKKIDCTIESIYTLQRQHSRLKSIRGRKKKHLNDSTITEYSSLEKGVHLVSREDKSALIFKDNHYIHSIVYISCSSADTVLEIAEKHYAEGIASVKWYEAIVGTKRMASEQIYNAK